MYYILHGDDEFTRAEKIAEVKQQVLGDGMGDLNITVLDGRQTELSELMSICNTLPFLTQRRLVIVENLLQGEEPAEQEGATRGKRRASVTAALLEYLPHLPSSTRLVLVESRSLNANHPVLKACRESKECYQREFRRPTDDELPAWIERRAEQKKVRIDRAAAALLAQWVGPDLRSLDRELEKLGAYADYTRPISDGDVRALVSRTHEDNIFALVDALGLRQGKRAMHLLQEMLDGGQSELYVLSMVARQVRLVLSVKELTEERKLSSSDVGRELHLRDFVVPKLLEQAKQFSMEALERAHRLVLGTDQGIKTGAVAPRLALELLVMEMCSRRAG